MVYLLFNQDMIFGIYSTMDLLKANCYIFIYQLFTNKKLDRDIYFRIKSKLFEVPEMNIVDLQILMKEAGIHAEYYELEKNGLTALKNIMEHIESRFAILEEKLGMDSRVTVTIPGRSALDNMMLTSEIENAWRELDVENYKVIISELREFIMKKIQRLQLNYDDRILFGNVSGDNASDVSYQVWPADIGNWNLPENSRMYGEGFAVCFEKQVPGVFGIVTNPLYGYIF